MMSNTILQALHKDTMLQAVQKFSHCYDPYIASSVTASARSVQVSKHHSWFSVLLESHHEACALRHAMYTVNLGVSEEHMPSLLHKGCSNLRPNFGIVLD